MIHDDDYTFGESDPRLVRERTCDICGHTCYGDEEINLDEDGWNSDPTLSGEQRWACPDCTIRRIAITHCDICLEPYEEAPGDKLACRHCEPEEFHMPDRVPMPDGEVLSWPRTREQELEERICVLQRALRELRSAALDCTLDGGEFSHYVHNLRTLANKVTPLVQPDLVR